MLCRFHNLIAMITIIYFTMDNQAYELIYVFSKMHYMLYIFPIIHYCSRFRGVSPLCYMIISKSYTLLQGQSQCCPSADGTTLTDTVE